MNLEVWEKWFYYNTCGSMTLSSMIQSFIPSSSIPPPLRLFILLFILLLTPTTSSSSSNSPPPPLSPAAATAAPPPTYASFSRYSSPFPLHNRNSYSPTPSILVKHLPDCIQNIWCYIIVDLGYPPYVDYSDRLYSCLLSILSSSYNDEDVSELSIDLDNLNRLERAYVPPLNIL